MLIKLLVIDRQVFPTELLANHLSKYIAIMSIRLGFAALLRIRSIG
jgi:hypothetical protein